MVSMDDLEAELSYARLHAAGAEAGVFGPQSMIWSVEREAAIFLGAGRALLLQLAHPWVAAAVTQHSKAFADPVGRFHRTFRTVFTMVFGTLDQACDAARRLHRRHAGIAGRMPVATSPFALGSRYVANEFSALRWVHATLVETAPMACDLVLPPLSATERAQYYAESRMFAALFGISQTDLPKSWDEFMAYNEAMWASDVLTVTPQARAVADELLRGRRFGFRAPKWYLAVTARLLPPRIRQDFKLPYDEAEQRLATRTLRRLRSLYSILPASLRYVGPYQEAVGRLAGNARPSFLTGCSNRFWIGQGTLGC